jgi:hypothetical protein
MAEWQYAECRYAECRYAECHYAIMLKVTYKPLMLSVIMLSVVRLSVVRLIVVAPFQWSFQNQGTEHTYFFHPTGDKLERLSLVSLKTKSAFKVKPVAMFRKLVNLGVLLQY